MKTDPRLARLWSDLKERPVGREGLLVQRLAPEVHWDFYAGVREPAGSRCVFMVLHDAILPPETELPHCRGIEVSRGDPRVAMPRSNATLELRLLSDSYEEIFDVLISDVVAAAGACDDEPTALDAVLGRLTLWQRFLKEVPPEGLSPEAQRGLFGELNFLKENMLPALGATTAVNAWRGPLRAVQDFQIGGIAVEVKTSIAKQPQQMRIASELQLDTTGLAHVFLVQISLKEHQGSGTTLPQMVQDLRNMLGGSGGAIPFEDLLFKAHYLDIHAQHYSKTGYTIRAEHHYRVTEGFPRIVETDLLAGVGNVSYSIGVAECNPYSIHQDELEGYLKAHQ